MDSFFKKALSNTDAAKNEWNVPDEAIWLAAREHFPKRKRRFFVWILLGAFMLSATGSVLYSLMGSAPQGDTDKPSALLETDGALPQHIDRPDPFTTDPSKHKNQDPLASVQDQHRPDAAEEGEEVTTIAPANVEQAPIPNAHSIRDSESREDDGVQQDLKSTSPLISSKPRVNKERADAPSLEDETGRQQISSPMMTWKESNLVWSGRRLPITSQLDPPAIQRAAPKWSAGLAYSLYPIGWINSLYIEEDGESLSIDVMKSSTVGAQFELMRWLSPRWSLQSGLVGYSFDLDLNASVRTTLTDQDIDEIQPFSRISSARSSSNVRIEPETVVLKEGVQLVAGDVIDIGGDLSLKLSAVEIPIILNRHWIRPKGLAYHAGAGVGVGIFKANQSEVELFFLRNDLVINQPYFQEVHREKSLQFSFYLQGGMRYPIAREWDIGANLRISVLDPLATAIDVGVRHYW
ncbi:MAG: hypothetical protein KTR24_00325 [Saprospiraceae bacterium]|nr:hypothetical protein [Saprospiraceae bacterium]